MSNKTKSKSKSKKTTHGDSGALALFQEIADQDDPEIASMEGIFKLGEILGLDATTDVRILSILWKFGAKTKPGCITKTEFLSGMESSFISDKQGLINSLYTFDIGFLEFNEYREFYKFVFQFSREGTNKTLEKDLVIDLLPIVLDLNRAPHLEYFIQFLKSISTPRITFDEWTSFLQFQNACRVDLVGYDENGAWPVLLDEYVAWRKQNL